MCLKLDGGLAAAISHSLGESGKVRHSAKVLALAEPTTRLRDSSILFPPCSATSGIGDRSKIALSM